MTREEAEIALDALKTGKGGGNTTQICIEALEYVLEHKKYPLMNFATKYCEGEEDHEEI